jgi:hypothetical protein
MEFGRTAFLCGAEAGFVHLCAALPVWSDNSSLQQHLLGFHPQNQCYWSQRTTQLMDELVGVLTERQSPSHKAVAPATGAVIQR